MEIPITDIDLLRIGQTENTEAGTGCTVLIAENGRREYVKEYPKNYQLPICEDEQMQD